MHRESLDPPHLLILLELCEWVELRLVLLQGTALHTVTTENINISHIPAQSTKFALCLGTGQKPVIKLQ